MSGIVVLMNPDGQPINRELLQRMTQSLAFRGPDRQDTWADGCVGFGHTLLRTTFESESEHQPYTLDGDVWIVSDARVDGRDDLKRHLEAEGHKVVGLATDVELILRAYDAWGLECMTHLIGDMVFAIWDKRRQRLFVARDHMGMKPLYYALVGGSLVLSNTLNCLRLHPVVSNELNDLAIGDFLLFGSNQDPAATTFADIRRLPPAHRLTTTNGRTEVKRYWTLPQYDEIRYPRASDYVDHFRELLRTAVDDRLRTNVVNVSMSGGLDSTGVAATAHSLLSKQSASFDLRAFTIVYDRVIPDREGYYAGLAADSIGIPLYYLTSDDYEMFATGNGDWFCPPEPFYVDPFDVSRAMLQQLADHSRVTLTGWDGDAILKAWPKWHFHYLFKERRFRSLAAGLGWYLLSQRQLPPVGFRTWLRGWSHHPPDPSAYPAWLNESFERRVQLADRWEMANQKAPPAHQRRPEAYQLLSAPTWSYVIDGSDGGVIGLPLETRHPFADLRVIAYALSVPVVPWAVKKELLRAALKGTLPESVRLRPKAPLVGDPLIGFFRERNLEWVDSFQPLPELNRYVDRAKVPRITGDQSSESVWMNLRPFMLNHWLHHAGPR